VADASETPDEKIERNHALRKYGLKGKDEMERTANEREERRKVSSQQHRESNQSTRRPVLRAQETKRSAPDRG